jgi:exonuclease VII large subunit
VAITNKDAVNNALTAYNALSAPAKALLAEEKELLDGLKDKIAQLEAAANQAAAEDFKTAHAAALALTVSNAAIAHKDAVDAALEAYNGLSAAVKALLAGEKALLDNLAARIAQLYPEHELTFLEKTLIVEDRTGGLMNQADLDKIQEAFTQKGAELLQLEAAGNAIFIDKCRDVLDRGFRIIFTDNVYTPPPFTTIDYRTISASILVVKDNSVDDIKDSLYAKIINGLHPMPAPGTGE